MKNKQFFKKFKEIKDFLFTIFKFKKRISSIEQTERIMKKISRKGAKDYFTGDDTLSINGKNKLIKEKINEEAHFILKQAINDPELLLKFIKSKGTVIIKARYMDKILSVFGETEGFITPMSGLKALLFTLVINAVSLTKLNTGNELQRQKFFISVFATPASQWFKTPALFALKDEPINIYNLSHQFHLWLSYINKLPGFEEKTMCNFKEFWKVGETSKDISFLPVDEIMSLKDIISREMEALTFVKEMARELVGQKKSLKKLQQGESVNL